MATTTDRVIVQLEAKLDRYNKNIEGAQRSFDRALGGMQTRSGSLEKAMRRDADAIGSSFKRMAGTIAGAFGAAEVARLADSWTQYTNRLRTAGLEGEALAQKQDQLLEIANRNGVEVQALGQLYGRLAVASKELGANETNLVDATAAVAASLRVMGTDTEAARGGLLQLSQAFASPRVEMEEFGSILDGLPALVQELARNIPAAEGSVAKLRQIIKDRSGPGLS